MSIVVRAIDVGFGHTKYVTATTNGRVDCTHFPSLAYFGHAEEPVESMGGKRRTVQVPVDGLLYEVGPDVELAADRFRSRQLHDGGLDNANRVVRTNVVLQALRHQCDLRSILSFDESLHDPAPKRVASL